MRSNWTVIYSGVLTIEEDYNNKNIPLDFSLRKELAFISPMFIDIIDWMNI